MGWDGDGDGDDGGASGAPPKRRRKGNTSRKGRCMEGRRGGGELQRCRGGVLTILIFEMASPQSSSRYFAFLE